MHTDSGSRKRIIAVGVLVGAAAAYVAVTRWMAAGDRAEVARIASLLEIQPGSEVADIGAGGGRFALALAPLVEPSGRVLATEIDAELRVDISENAADAQLRNIVVLEAGEHKTGLPDACCDGAMMRGVYHHLTEPAAIGTDLARALRPGARLIVIDFPPSRWLTWFFPVRGVPPDRGGHGIAPDIVIRELDGAGFLLEHHVEDWRAGNYALVFRRR